MFSVLIVQIGKMLKPEKWRAFFDCDGKVFGFQKALKLIILGVMFPFFSDEFCSIHSHFVLS